jgi:hypothetical protein
VEGKVLVKRHMEVTDLLGILEDCAGFINTLIIF